MSFTQHWFEGLGKKNFEQLKNIIDINKPINFLEIGCFEGNCHKWMYENILIHPQSKSTVIDPFDMTITHLNWKDSIYNSFTQNLSNYLEKINIQKGFSDDILPILEKNSYDIIYIDGDHSANAAFKDGINSIDLLKKDGIMIFDDYLWIGTNAPDWNKNGNIGNFNNPCIGINLFYEANKKQFELLKNFVPECKIIDLNKLYNDREYRDNYTTNYNYQIFLKKKY